MSERWSAVINIVSGQGRYRDGKRVHNKGKQAVDPLLASVD